MCSDPRDARISDVLDVRNLEVVWRNGRAWIPLIAYENLYLRHRRLLDDITTPTQEGADEWTEPE